ASRDNPMICMTMPGHWLNWRPQEHEENCGTAKLGEPLNGAMAEQLNSDRPWSARKRSCADLHRATSNNALPFSRPSLCASMRPPRRCGLDHYLTKPVDFDELAKRS